MGKIKIPLGKHFPDGFDPDNMSQVMSLTVILEEFKATHKDYADYELYDYTSDQSAAIIAPANLDPTDSLDDFVIQKVTASDGSGLAAQKKTVERFEAMSEYAGLRVIDFNLLPSGSYVVRMQQMDPSLIATREQFANALGVKPWQIHVTRTVDHGYRIRWPEGQMTWNGDRDDKMQTAVDIIAGKKDSGWFFRAYPLIRTIVVHQGVMPTFAPIIQFPKELEGKNDLRHAYIGMKLPERGRETGEWLYNDWKQNSGILVVAGSNSGKSVVVNDLIAAALEAGCDLAVCDNLYKSVDFRWCRPWVIHHGWGCDSPEAAEATLTYILDLVGKRADHISRQGAENWWDLDEQTRKDNPPLLLVCDEVAQWAGKVTVSAPKGTDRRAEQEYNADIHSANADLILKITQIARFAGIFFLFAAQSARLQDGIDPGMRQNLTAFITPNTKLSPMNEELLGGSKAIPEAYETVRGQQGVGYALLDGNVCVYKGFFDMDPGSGKKFGDLLRDRVMKTRPVEIDENAGHWERQEIIDLVPGAFSFEGAGETSGNNGVVDIEPVKIKGADGKIVDATDIASAVGL